MVAVVYVGTDGSPKKTKTLGHEFELNKETEVTDRDALVRLARNPGFKVLGEVPPDPDAKAKAKRDGDAAKALDAETIAASAKIAAEQQANANRITDAAHSQEAARLKSAEAREKEISEHKARAAAHAAALRKSAGHPEPKPED